MSSATHYHPLDTPHIDARDYFLVDGCERCAEYVEMLGRPFDPARFRAFWDKMVRVEWDHTEVWQSKLDAELGHKLYLVALQFQVAFGLDPHELATFRERFMRLVAAIPE
jgi:hypothetical protein